jgi:molybdopterin/thiamine biosynthesis adenylyltransferase
MPRDAFFDDGPPVAQLQVAAKGLSHLVRVLVPLSDPPADASGSSGLVTHPTAAQAFGKQPFVSTKWRDLPRLHVALLGLNAVGARAAEALARTGVGKLLLVDAPQHSPVARDALCEMAFEADEVGFSRTQALKLRLQSFAATEHARTKVETLVADVTHAADRAELQKKLKMSVVGLGDQPATDGSDAPPSATAKDQQRADVGLFEALTLKRPYDAVVCCTADAAAKRALNSLCLELSLPLVDIELSPTNSSVTITTVLPGATCCLDCIASARVATPMDEVVQSLASAFPAVMPHVELTAAGLAAQQVLKCVSSFSAVFMVDSVDVFTSLHAQVPAQRGRLRALLPARHAHVPRRVLLVHAQPQLHQRLVPRAAARGARARAE